MKSHKELQDFRKKRRNAEEILGLKLYRGASEVKELDRHVKKFRGALHYDAAEKDQHRLQQVSHEFESELHAELDKLMQQTRKDLATYMKTLEEWSLLKEELHGRDSHSQELLKTELKYAQILHKSMMTRLDSLNQSFHRLRKR